MVALVKIGLADLPKSGGAIATPAPPLNLRPCLTFNYYSQRIVYKSFNDWLSKKSDYIWTKFIKIGHCVLCMLATTASTHRDSMAKHCQKIVQKFNEFLNITRPIYPYHTFISVLSFSISIDFSLFFTKVKFFWLRT